MINKIKVSVIIVTFNEEKRIRRCLESVRWADEVVIVDQSSTDNTAAICREYTRKVSVVSNKGYCEPDRPLALSKASNEWILYLDADESITDGLRQEIEETLGYVAKFDSYYIPRKNMYLGKWVRYSGWYPNYIMRLFRKDKVTFSDRIHTDVTPIGTSGHLKNAIEHYTYESIEEHVSKMIRYTNVLARQSFERKERITARNFFWKLALLPLGYSLKKYIFKQGYRDGVRGFLIAAFTFMTVFAANAKLWEMARTGRSK